MSIPIWFILGTSLGYLTLKRKNLLKGNTAWIILISVLALVVIPAAVFVLFASLSTSQASSGVENALYIAVPLAGVALFLLGVTLKSKVALTLIILGIVEEVASLTLSIHLW